MDSLALANVQLNMNISLSRFFKKTAHYPNFKSRKFAKKSYTANAVYLKKKDGSICCNISLDPVSGLLKLPKHKDTVQLRLHRSIQPDGKLKSVTVTMEPDGKRYYSILMEYPKQELTRDLDLDNAIGLDMSLPKLYVDSNGNTPDFPKPYRTIGVQNQTGAKKALPKRERFKKL